MISGCKKRLQLFSRVAVKIILFKNIRIKLKHAVLCFTMVMYEYNFFKEYKLTLRCSVQIFPRRIILEKQNNECKRNQFDTGHKKLFF